MLVNLLLSTLLDNIIYLGYHKRFTSTRMLIDLQGLRKGLELHNLSSTIINFQRVLRIIHFNWIRFSCIWVIAPKSQVILNHFYKRPEAESVEDFLYFWCERWKSGFLTNYSGFLSMLTRVQYPNTLFYTNYTHNRDKFIEARGRGILALGLADSNSQRQGYDFSINANEKGLKSYVYFVNALFLQSLKTFRKLRRELFII